MTSSGTITLGGSLARATTQCAMSAGWTIAARFSAGTGTVGRQGHTLKLNYRCERFTTRKAACFIEAINYRHLVPKRVPCTVAGRVPVTVCKRPAGEMASGTACFLRPRATKRRA